MAIYFFTSTDEYGFLSNFSRHEFELDGHRWPTVEHYFQAQKFPGTPLFGRIRNAPGPKEAKALGRTRDVKIRPDWDTVRDDVMRRAIWRKFEVHADLAARLLATGDEELIENAPNDYYWGHGRSLGVGRLGVLESKQGHSILPPLRILLVEIAEPA